MRSAYDSLQTCENELIILNLLSLSKNADVADTAFSFGTSSIDFAMFCWQNHFRRIDFKERCDMLLAVDEQDFVFEIRFDFRHRAVTSCPECEYE